MHLYILLKLLHIIVCEFDEEKKVEKKKNYKRGRATKEKWKKKENL